MKKRRKLKKGNIAKITIIIVILGLSSYYFLKNDKVETPKVEKKEEEKKEIEKPKVEEKPKPVLSNYEQKKQEWTDTTKEDMQVPIYMYHDVNTTSDTSNGNSIPIEKLEEHFKYLKEQGRVAITLDDFIKYQKDELAIPKKSIVITFDDGYKNMTLVGPLLQKYNLFATTFLIGEKVDNDTTWFVNSEDIEVLKNQNMFFGNHTFAMHNGGEGGRGLITLWSVEDGVADLNKMRERFNSNTVCYPLGHHDGNAIETVKTANYAGAVTIEYDFATKTSNSYALPRIRVNAGTLRPELP